MRSKTKNHETALDWWIIRAADDGWPVAVIAKVAERTPNRVRRVIEQWRRNRLIDSGWRNHTPALRGVGSPCGAQLRAGSLSGDTMTLGRHYLFVPLVLGSVILPATAYAKAPSQAHIRFRVPSTLSQAPVPQANDAGYIGGVRLLDGREEPNAGSLLLQKHDHRSRLARTPRNNDA